MEQNEKGERQKGHVLVLPFPLQGHVNPMLQFSKRLQSKGVKTTLVTTNRFLKGIADASLSFPIETISDGFDEGTPEGQNLELYLKTFQEVGSQTLAKVLDNLHNSGNTVECIVYDAFFPWVLDVIKNRAILGAVFFTQSCAVGSIYYHVYKGVIKIPLEKKEDDILLPGLPALCTSDLPSFVTVPEEYPAVGDIVVNQFCNIDRADWVFFNTFYKLEQENEKGERQKGHVWVLPYPIQGHVNPMLQFSKRLQNKGVKTTLVTTKRFLKGIADESLSFPIETISDGFDEGFPEGKSTELYLKTFQEVGSETLAKVLDKLHNSGNTVDCIVYDAFFPWVLDVIKNRGILGAVFFTQSCAVGSIYYHVYKGVIKIPLEKKEDDALLPGLPALRTSDLPSFLTVPEQYPAIRELVVGQFCNIDRADWVFFNTFYKLEQEVIDWMTKLWQVRPIGPTVPSMYLDKRLQHDKVYGLNVFKPSSDVCNNWLKQRNPKSVVYVSFGSLASLDSEAMAELAWGLKLCEKYFLWVVRSSEEAKLPANFVSEKGLIVSWCPQLEVLANESIGCFVTHCGWNSTLEAMALGVPLVVMPQWTDQHTNAKYLMDVWKMGVKAQPDVKGLVRREVISNCIKEVMDGERGEEIKASSAKWKELTREAMDEGGTSDKNINAFVSNLSDHHSHSVHTQLSDHDQSNCIHTGVGENA